jgi:hypothetical protein
MYAVFDFRPLGYLEAYTKYIYISHMKFMNVFSDLKEKFHYINLFPIKSQVVVQKEVRY